MIEKIDNIKVSATQRLHDIELTDKINEVIEHLNRLETQKETEVKTPQ